MSLKFTKGVQKRTDFLGAKESLKRKLVDIICKGRQTANFVRWSAAQRTTEMLADQRRTGKNSGPAPADYRNWASASPLLNYLREVI
jgi:predicted secreted protein